MAWVYWGAQAALQQKIKERIWVWNIVWKGIIAKCALLMDAEATPIYFTFAQIRERKMCAADAMRSVYGHRASQQQPTAQFDSHEVWNLNGNERKPNLNFSINWRQVIFIFRWRKSRALMATTSWNKSQVAIRFWRSLSDAWKMRFAKVIFLVGWLKREESGSMLSSRRCCG